MKIGDTVLVNIKNRVHECEIVDKSPSGDYIEIENDRYDRWVHRLNIVEILEEEEEEFSEFEDFEDSEEASESEPEKDLGGLVRWANDRNAKGKK